MTNTLIQNPGSLEPQFPFVRLTPGVNYGSVKINGNVRNVDEPYINSPEVAHALAECLALVGDGVLAAVRASNALERIQHEKLYLRFRDADGSPRFSTFEAFLQETQNINRTQYGQMRKAAEGYRWLVDNRGEEYAKDLRQSQYLFRELALIEPGNRNEALDAIVARSGKDGLTGDALKQWRQSKGCANSTTSESASSSTQPLVSTPQAPAATSPEITEASNAAVTVDDSSTEPVILDAEVVSKAETEADVQETNAAAESTGAVSAADSEVANLTFQAEGVKAVAEEARTSETIIRVPNTEDHPAEETPMTHLRDPNYDFSVDEMLQILLWILGENEFIQGVAKDTVNHSRNVDLKPGEKTMAQKISEAITAYNKTYNTFQMQEMCKPRNG